MLTTPARTRSALRRSVLLLATAAVVAGPAAQAADEDPEDLTAPVLRLTRDHPANEAGWHRAPVVVTVAATDNANPLDTGISSLTYEMTGAQAGSGRFTGRPDRTAGGPVTVNTEGSTTLTALAVDGNSNETPGAITLHLDLTDPTVTLTSPAPGASYPQGATVAADYGCADARSGVQVCDAPAPNGGDLDTTELGPHTFTVTATDAAGRTTQVTRAYSVYGEFRTDVPPTIVEATARVGQVVHATPGTYTPTPEGSHCSWLRDGQPIDGETRLAYTVRAEDLGSTLHFRCTVDSEQYADLTVTSPTGVVVAPGALPDDAARGLSLAGAGVVGGELVASYETPHAGDRATLQWRRDGVPLPEQTRRYVLSAADRGHTISAIVVVERAGYAAREFTAGSVAVTRGRPLTADGPVRVSGTPKVGQRLSATAPGVRGATTADPYTTRIEWLRDGAVVGTGATYAVTAADAGHKLTARLVAAGAAYETLTVASDAVTAAKATPALAVKAKAKRGQVRLSLTATAPGTSADGKVVVKRGKKVVGKGTLRNGKLTLTLKKQKPGKVSYVVTYAGNAGVAPAKATVKVRVR